MMKRIICLILTLVMLALSLVGCGYSYVEDDLNQYVTYNETLLKQQLKNLVITIGAGEDELDPEKREQAIWDTIYAALAANLSDTGVYTEELDDENNRAQHGAHDLIQYNYYYTFKDSKGLTHQAENTYIGTKASLQMGLNTYSNALAKAVAKYLNENPDYYILAENRFAKLINEETVVEGAYATITYKYEYAKVDDKGNPVLKEDGTPDKETGSETVTKKIDSKNPLHSALIGKPANKSVEDKVEIAAGSAFSIKNVEVNQAITLSEINVGTVKSEVTAGKLASITYSFTYTKDGETAATKGTVKNSFEVISEDNPLHKALLGYKVGDVYETTVIRLDEKGNPVKDDKGKVIEDPSKEIKIPANSGFVINGETVKEAITFTEVSVDYYVGGTAIESIVPVYDDSKATITVKDILGNEYKDVDVSTVKYYVYPYGYQKVDEYDAYNIVDRIIGKTATSTYKTSMITDITNAVIYGLGLQITVDESDTEAYDAAVEAQKTKLKEKFNIKGISATESATALDSLVTKIVDAMIDYNTKNSAVNSATTAVNTAKDEVSKKEAAYEEAAEGDAKTQAKTELDAAKATLKEKEKALEKAEADKEAALLYKNAMIAVLVNKDFTSVTEAKAAYVSAYNNLLKVEEENPEKLKAAEKAVADAEAALNAASADKKAAAEKALADAKSELEAVKAAPEQAKKAFEEAAEALKKLAAIDSTAAQTLVDGYFDYQFVKTLDTFRTNLKNAIVKEIDKIIGEIKLTGIYPTEPVDEAYDLLMNEYKYTFYNKNYQKENSSGTLEDYKDEEGNTITNYTMFNGSFEEFLIAAKGTASEANPYEAAENAVRADAQAQVATVIKFSVVAKLLGQTYTDDEFEQYQDENKDLYTEREYAYGESAVRNALQYDKLMNYFLESKEETPNANYPLYKQDKYVNIDVVTLTK